MWASEESSSGTTGLPRRILVVDDEPDILESLKTLLEAAFPGVEVHAAADGDEALVVLRAHDVDLVITDYRMPGMDGFQLLERVKAMAPAARLALITAFDPHWEQHNWSKRLDLYLRKPLDAEGLKEATSRLLHA